MTPEEANKRYGKLKRSPGIGRFGRGTGAGRPYTYSRDKYDEAARLLATGLSGGQVAKKLDMSYTSIRSMMRRIFQGKTPYDLDGKFPEDELNKD